MHTAESGAGRYAAGDRRPYRVDAQRREERGWLPPLDLILLRNVLIYFDSPSRQRILGKVRRVLQPDGYLLLGGAETTHNLDDGFTPVSFEQVSFFRLRASATETTR